MALPATIKNIPDIVTTVKDIIEKGGLLNAAMEKDAPNLDALIKEQEKRYRTLQELCTAHKVDAEEVMGYIIEQTEKQAKAKDKKPRRE